MANSSSPRTPISLLERVCRTTDAQAWERFVDLYTPLLYFWLRRNGLQEADAADLVQEVFIVLFRKLPEFKYSPSGSFRNWLRTVTLNKYRESQRRKSPLVLAEPSQLPDNVRTDELAELEEKEYRQYIVQKALDLLRDDVPPTTWRIFEQYVLSNRPASAVAAEQGVSVSTVYAVKSQILRRLRDELSGLLD